MNVSDEALKRLLERFGHQRFRPGQERVIRDLLRGRDVLAVLATGSGKSLAFQMSAQLLPGVTIVVSPLIALMQDQEESVEDLGMEVGVVNSTLTESQAEDEIEEAREEETKLLYVTPERFENEEFLDEMRDVEVSLFVVDEAHCISQWGHDFRPAYLRLAAAIELLGRPPVLALTATAPPIVREEISERLGLRDPDLVVYGVDRPNLFYEVVRIDEPGEERGVLQALLQGEPRGYPEELESALAEAMTGAGIIYVRTRKGAEETAGWLNEWGIAADYYHGQRGQTEREQVQAAFMDGSLRVVVATNAFGLGVDKPDVRFVIHRDVPASIEAYYQEAGRAGRDGELARCTLIYRPADLSRAAFLAASSTVDEEDLRAVVDALRVEPETTPAALHERAGLGEGLLERALDLLDGVGAIERTGPDLVQLVDPAVDPATISLESEEQRKAYERSRVEMMRGYAEMSDCRRRYILNYFGEEYGREHCDLCDNDVRQGKKQWHTVEPEAEIAAPFTVGDTVEHAEWGRGTVQRLTDDAVTVLFDSVGFKTLSLAVVLEEGLLS